MSTSRRIVCLVLLLPTAVFGTQFGQIPVTQVIGTPSITNDTNVTLTLGGTPTDAVLKPFSLTLGWTGQLSAARGGTGTTLGAEPPLGNPSTNGYVLSSTTGGVRSWIAPGGGGGSGTVTSFSAGNLSPLFTTSVSNPTTTPALSFTGVAVAQGSWFGNASGVTAVPIFNNPGDLTKTDDTNVTLALGGTPVGSLLKAVSITAGWTGTLAISRGGTGAATSSANTWFGNSTASSAAPTFNSAGALTETDDTNVTLTLGGTPATSLLKAVSITAGWTGTLSQARGGFGKSTAAVTDGQIPIGRSSDNSWQLATLTAGSNVTITNGGGTVTIASSGGAGGVTSLTQVAPIVLTPNPIVGTGTVGLDVSVDHAFTAAQTIKVSDAGTINAALGLTVGHNSSATPTTNFGTLLKFTAKSSTTNDQDLAGIQATWSNATQGSNASDLYFQVRQGGGSLSSYARVSSTGGFSVDSSTPPAAGAGIISAGAGFKIANATPTSGLILQSNGSQYQASTPTWPTTAGASGNLVTSNGTNFTSSALAVTSPITNTSGNIGLSKTVDLAMTAAQTVKVTDSATGITNVLLLGHNLTPAPTPQANFGTGFQLLAQSDTTNDRTLGTYSGGWTDPADATRTSVLEMKAVLNGVQHTSKQGLALWGSRGLTLNRPTDPGQGWMDVSAGYKIGGSALSSDNLVTSATNDSATAGEVGETISSAIVSGSATALTSSTAKNVTSISLTAGDWNVSGNVVFVGTSSTISVRTAVIGTTSVTIADDGYQSYNNYPTSTLSESGSCALPSRRFSLASTTTVYLVCRCTFGAGSVSAYGFIQARRVR